MNLEGTALTNNKVGFKQKIIGFIDTVCTTITKKAYELADRQLKDSDEVYDQDFENIAVAVPLMLKLAFVNRNYESVTHTCSLEDYNAIKDAVAQAADKDKITYTYQHVGDYWSPLTYPEMLYFRKSMCKIEIDRCA